MQISKITIAYLLFFCFSAKAAERNVTPHIEEGMELAVLAAPDAASSDVVFTVERSERLSVIGETLHWYHVESDGETGYVHKRYVEQDEHHQELLLYIYDGEKANAQVIHCPNGKNILFNAGSNYKNSDDELKAYFLDKLGHHSRTIHYSFVSSPDLVNYSILRFLNETFNINSVFFTGTQSDYTRGFWSWLKETNSKKIAVSEEVNIDCGGARVTTFVLATGIDHYPQTGAAISMALSIEYKGIRLLLTGQTSKELESKVIEKQLEFGQDLLVASAFRGSATDVSTSLIRSVDPKVMIINGNSYGWAQQSVNEVVKRLTKTFSDFHEISNDFQSDLDDFKPLFSTPVAGNIQVRVEENGSFSVTSEHLNSFTFSKERSYASHQ